MTAQQTECPYIRIVQMRLKSGQPKQDVFFCGGNDLTCEWVRKNLKCPLDKEHVTGTGFNIGRDRR